MDNKSSMRVYLITLGIVVIMTWVLFGYAMQYSTNQTCQSANDIRNDFKAFINVAADEHYVEKGSKTYDAALEAAHVDSC